MANPHYVCTGSCKGVSDTPMVCHAQDCNKKGEPFVECNCEDGNHDEAYKKSGDGAAI